MATYYVDLSASSNGTGTELSPYYNFAAFASSITSGDRIRVKCGTSKVLTAGTRLNITISGSAETIIDTYGTGANPVLSGGGTNYNPIYVKRVDGSGNLIIRDLDVTNTPNDGIAVESQSAVTISNVLIQRCRAYGTNVLNGAGKDGIRIGCAKDGGLISNVVIDSCDAFSNSGHGIKVRDNTQNIIVRNCRAWANGSGSPAHGMGTSHSRALVASAGAWAATSGGAYQAAISTTSLFKTTITTWLAVFCSNQNGYFWLTPTASSPPSAGQFYTGGSNTLEINVGAAPTAAGVYAAYLQVDGRFELCEVWNTNDTDGNEGHGFGTDDLTQNAVYVGCISRDNEGAGWTGNLSQAATLMGCVSRNNAKQGFYATGGKNVTLYNNTFAENTLQGFRVQSGGTGAYFRNNIFAENGGYGISSSSASYTIDEDYNCVYGNVGGEKENVSSSGANGITTAPLLDSSYRPSSSSPCVGAGTYIAGVKDYSGRKLKRAPDIGAVQYYAPRSRVNTFRDSVLVSRRS
jgi:parallel beta-helix repeat protein